MAKNIPYVVMQATDSRTAYIVIQGDISWWSEMNNSDAFTRKIDEAITAGCVNVNLYINSGGGDTHQANEMCNQLTRFKGKKIGYIGALCASAATLLACTMDEVYAMPNTLYMVHNPCLMAYGGLKEFESAKQLWQITKDNAAELYAKKTGKPLNQIIAMMDAETWFSAKSAKEYGWITDIIDAIPFGVSEDPAAILEELYKPYSEAIKEQLTSMQSKLTASVTMYSVNNQVTITTDNNNNMEGKKIAVALGLAETADENAIMAAIAGMKSQNENFATMQREQVKQYVTSMIASGKATEAERQHWESLGNASMTLLQSTAEKLTARMSASRTITPSGGTPPADEKEYKTLIELMADGEAFDRERNGKTQLYMSLYKAHYGFEPKF
ncbi:Clp protease [Flexibacter flexilis DSM 6793]|uniref:ATP-dependent Clp protease proteolytic subunit n=1 Tax=Flexibacter flexilis DSM 6793 TaxID=927664 RepID=A0A1I1E674_9BACT|nr:ATP-dependent Clp protease proteolytic subunit [Flexibacter flexilis]SFB80393.1 Clp protease [Flexibacter flexilis DSM 6793]